MIIAEQKPLDEINQMITPYERVLVLGCGTCMTVCNAGGEHEVSFLHHALQVAQTRSENAAHTFSEFTVKRQCDSEFLTALTDRIDDIDAVLNGIEKPENILGFTFLEELPGHWAEAIRREEVSVDLEHYGRQIAEEMGVE